MKFTTHFPTALAILLLSCSPLFAQNPKATMPSDFLAESNSTALSSGTQYAPLSEVVVPSDNQNQWMRSIETKRIHDQTIPLEAKEAALIDLQKQLDLTQPELAGFGPQASVEEFAGANPVVVTGFNATALNGGFPPDNTIAISNGGYILSAMNSKVAVYNTSGSLLLSAGLYDFFKGYNHGVVNDFYDPVVLYDSGADRFVFVCLVGKHSSNSRVLVAFSKTNNPAQAWNIYYLSGNPLNNNCWLDYPRVGVSNNEVYVTGNLYLNNGSFNQAIIYQITKSGGYNGNASLQWQYWHNIPGAPSTIMPLSWGGQGNYGPGCYLVSHTHLSNAQTYLFDITKDLTASDEQLVRYVITTPTFQKGYHAYQKNSSERLDSGDPRIQSGFFQDGIAHYVFAARYNNTAWTGIHYHRINVSSKALTTRQIGASNWDFAWPSVAWSGTASNNKSAMINFLYSSSTVFPSAAVVEVDNSNTVSPNSIAFGTGTNLVNLDNQSWSRWGDYTGIVRKKNTSTAPRLWTVACIGGGASQQYATRIAQIRPGGSNLDEEGGDRDEQTLPEIGALLSDNSSLTLFPNPVALGKPFSLDFTLEEKTLVRVDIFSADGRLVHTLLDDAVKPGETRITFNQQALTPGAYMVRFTAEGKPMKTVKLLVSP
jgi:hypothetical protein